MIVLTDKHKIPFQVDESDYEGISRYFWYITGVTGYPSTNIGKWPETRHMIELHRFLLGPAPEGMEWDHINRDKLDNRRANLRAVTGSVNQRNKWNRSDNSSGFRGVSWLKQREKWEAYIQAGGRKRHLGLFTDRGLAINARLMAERQFFGYPGVIAESA